MTKEIDNLKARWRCEAGQRLMEIALHPKPTVAENQAEFAAFLGVDRWLIKSEVHRGMGEFPDLRGIDLSGRDLQGAWFKDELSYSNFEGAVLNGAAFGGSKLYYASFKNAHATQRTEFFEIYAQHANFEGVRLYDANFCGADLRGANFRNAVLDHCDFSGAMLMGANLEGSRFIDCGASSLQLSEHHKNEAWFKESTFVRPHIIWVPD